jgi:hypothetical protein
MTKTPNNVKLDSFLVYGDHAQFKNTGKFYSLGFDDLKFMSSGRISGQSNSHNYHFEIAGTYVSGTDDERADEIREMIEKQLK